MPFILLLLILVLVAPTVMLPVVLVLLVFLLGLGLTGHFTLWGIVLALLLAHVLARPVGALMQRTLTTDPDVGDLEVVGAGDASPQMGLNLFFPLGSRRYFVQTRARRPVHWLLRWF